MILLWDLVYGCILWARYGDEWFVLGFALVIFCDNVERSIGKWICGFVCYT